MSSQVLDVVPTPGVTWERLSARRLPVAVGLLAALVRLTWATAPPGSDEAGFLTVAAQWRPGSSLYGRYWVDRPPLLVAVFDAADHLGGVAALRVLGALATLVTVVAVGALARRATGSTTAAAVASVTAAALLTSPLAGAFEVNGELLTAPFVATGVLGLVVALQARRARDLWTAGAGAGACAAAALLVKQNIADVAVVGVLLGAACLHARHARLGRLARTAVAAALGGTAVGTVTAAWALLHGTRLAAVWWATYPFRVQAGQVLASSPSTAASHRGLVLLGTCALSGIVSVAVGAVLVARRPGPDSGDEPLLPTRSLLLVVLAWTAWVCVSVVMGGNYWSHYLVQLAVPTSLVVGVVATRRPALARWLVAGCLVPALVSAVAVAVQPPVSSDERVGAAVGRASAPGDSIVVTWGHAAIVHGSGLASPYPLLWSLPTKTLDPRLQGLDRVLAGPSAPTWFVTAPHLPSWGLSTSRTAALLRERYHHVATLCGDSVYLRSDLARPIPRAVQHCG